ncbi:hypothetical protein D8674_003881 [Pyrus ussuriensis x Pyrus communis]|uniref:Uncharacterized protein n=1 Tax=Pyrus ussuriensis x Pyrus communis TaxID=2448454 RepID=A0A5N5FIA2_9ROSA|nr:hypothetical protein D8674_003881 [Pyrus ussuriensis x Pyrus communis]
MAANSQVLGTSSRCRRSISLPRLTPTRSPSWNVTLIKSRELMGKMFRKSEGAEFIYKELALCWKECVKKTLFANHFGNKWFALQFTDEDEVDYVLDNRHWYVKWQIFHLERWTKQLRESDQIIYLR